MDIEKFAAEVVERLMRDIKDRCFSLAGVAHNLGTLPQITPPRLTLPFRP
jgi:hypothetical protein